MSGGIQVAE